MVVRGAWCVDITAERGFGGGGAVPDVKRSLTGDYWKRPPPS